MKNNFLYTFLTGLLLMATTQSCRKDFFDLYPTDQLSPGSFWQTESDAVAALTGCYNSLGSVNTFTLLYLDVITPNAYNEYPWEGWKDIARSAHTPLGPEGPWRIWSGCFQGIGRVNDFLANIDKPEMDEGRRSVMRAEAQFLRAYFYFTLTNFYGGVPLFTEPPALEHATRPRASKAEVIAQVMQDLDNAIAALPVHIPASENGHATKGAALALKAKVALYQGDWDTAASLARDVMDLNKYSLFPSYRGLFLPDNENNAEVIFDIQHVVPDFATAWDTLLGIYDGNILTAAIGWSSIEPTTDFVDEYEMIDGSVWSPDNPLADPADKYNNRDPRLDQTVFRKGKKYLGKDYPVDAQGYAGLYTGFSFKKYTVYDNDPGAPDIDYGKSFINIILLRYADVLLMYAEAQNEASGPDQSVYDAINAVRNRAGMPDLPAGLSQAEMRDRIRHERRIEFVIEGQYFLDVVRWGIANDVLNRDIVLEGSYKKGAIDIRTWIPNKNEVFPIPQREIDYSQGAIEQNPNY